ncbi:urea amidolyase associated protein UAAP1 [Naasia sp. SYSU D00057]|uniref:urea amidolyase associated protein UAAP1 n=1 Tax=Naasia sp. SYSU D00057 TaxID=2817380 RepID=UPI001B30D1D6|nr:urea amidolyase associated protein UAAP1 [Naasia sp. SYSU D00057]
MADTATAAPGTGTATTAGARAHARAQEGTYAEAQPFRPASSAPSLPEGAAADSVTWVERVAGGNYTHAVLARGTELRLTDVTGDACASVLVYNALQPVERLNVADTVKVQWQVYAGTGQLLLSDQARVLASVIEDTSGRHDTIYGASSRARNELRYGDGQPQGPSPAGRELFNLAAAKHGLGRRDLPPSVSFFQGVRIREDGSPEFLGSAGAGASVTLRIEMPAIVLIANAAHPLDPSEEYRTGPLNVVAWRGEPTTPSDPLWTLSPEGRRAFTNTADYLTARGIA